MSCGTWGGGEGGRASHNPDRAAVASLLAYIKAHIVSVVSRLSTHGRAMGQDRSRTAIGIARLSHLPVAASLVSPTIKIVGITAGRLMKHGLKPAFASFFRPFFESFEDRACHALDTVTSLGGR